MFCSHGPSYSAGAELSLFRRNSAKIYLDRFAGNGLVLTQASTAKRLPEPFHHDGATNTLMDYMNAFLGVRS
jgi:hypothetical protein